MVGGTRALALALVPRRCPLLGLPANHLLRHSYSLLWNSLRWNGCPLQAPISEVEVIKEADPKFMQVGGPL